MAKRKRRSKSSIEVDMEETHKHKIPRRNTGKNLCSRSPGKTPSSIMPSNSCSKYVPLDSLRSLIRYGPFHLLSNFLDHCLSSLLLYKRIILPRFSNPCLFLCFLSKNALLAWRVDLILSAAIFRSSSLFSNCFALAAKSCSLVLTCFLCVHIAKNS